MNKRDRRLQKNQQAPDAVAGGAGVVEEQKVEIVDGHEIGSKATDAELGAVEVAEGYKVGELVAARNEGKIAAFWSRASITVKAKKVAKGGKRAYVRLESLNGRGMNVLAKGIIDVQPKPKEGKAVVSGCDCFNYGLDLMRRVPVRQALEESLAGPEKAVKKLVLGLLAGEESPEDVRAFVKNSKKFKGVEGLDKLIDAALASAK
jgi:hypothetical protein